MTGPLIAAHPTIQSADGYCHTAQGRERCGGPTANQPRVLDTCVEAICQSGFIDTRALRLRSRARAARLAIRRLRETRQNIHTDAVASNRNEDVHARIPRYAGVCVPLIIAAQVSHGYM